MMIDLAKRFDEVGIDYELYEHDPIYTNEDAVIMKEEKGFTGTETKSLFLEGRSGQHYIYFTYTTKRTDFKQLRDIVGERLSVVKPERMEELTGQKPGAVSPFGYTEDIPLLIDLELLDEEKHVFAPGRPDRTMVTRAEDLPRIIEVLDLTTYDVPAE